MTCALFSSVLFDVVSDITLTTFFGGGLAGVFGNSTGGWRGAILAGIVAGLLLSLGQLLTVNTLQTTVVDFARWSNDFDYAVFPVLFKHILGVIF